jgi:hypothetical protein
MDTLIKTFESQKNGNKYHDFVLDDAIYYIKKAQEALTEGLLDPEEWYKNEQVNAKTFCSLFPHIYFTQQRLASEMDTCSSQIPTRPKSSP